MKLNFLRFFIPTDRKFFPLFERAASNLEIGGQLIYQLMCTNDKAERSRLIRTIEDIEHNGDEITHEIFQELSKNFITPFDREDIHRLVSAIDDVLDYIHGSAKRIELYKIENFTPDLIKLSELLQQQTSELRLAVFELRNMGNMRDITAALVRVNSIENHADDVFDRAVAGLFENESNAIELIKMKEVLSALETATDMCEDAANVIESIVVKMA
ncbi:phosphate transport regulator [Bacteroidota bacterium]|nr:phosphate transport regulator [Bacteroidota bacterium]